MTQRRRLTHPEHFLPWIKADRLDGCFLYWLPVLGFPITHDEKQWGMNFLARFSLALKLQEGLRAEVFLRYKGIDSSTLDSFMKYCQGAMTMIGIGKQPRAPLPKGLSEEELAEIVKGREPVDFRLWAMDYSYWFLKKEPEKQRELFMGLGIMTTLWLKPDPKTQAPKLKVTPALRAAHPVFQTMDVDGRYEASFSMQDRFLAESKERFGEGLRQERTFPGIAFVLPLPDSEDFFALNADMRDAWFDLFQVYFHESTVDKGFLLAFREDYEPLLLDVLDGMKNDKLIYPVERVR